MTEPARVDPPPAGERPEDELTGAAAAEALRDAFVARDAQGRYLPEVTLPVPSSAYITVEGVTAEPDGTFLVALAVQRSPQLHHIRLRLNRLNLARLRDRARDVLLREPQ